MEVDQEFWSYLEQLVCKHAVIIDRPKGSIHPHFGELIYPVDYGYLEGTTTLDSGGVDVWVGSSNIQTLEAILCTVDLNKCDVEVKILLGCTEDEIRQILQVTNSNSMRAILITRDD